MSKNAYVLEDHFGDDGHVTTGRILLDVSAIRFDKLEEQGLVREATPEEVKAGSQHNIDADESKSNGEKKAAEPANKQAPAPKNKGA